MTRTHLTRLGTRLAVAALLLTIAVNPASAAPKAKGHELSKPKPAADMKMVSKEAEKGMLDGWKFTGDVTTNGSTPMQDQLSFDKGKLMSSLSAKDGFSAIPYTAAVKDGVTSFSATSTNVKGDKVMWTGTIKDGQLDAALTLTPKGQAAVTKTEKAHRDTPVASPHN